jgi:hypothetical protein
VEAENFENLSNLCPVHVIAGDSEVEIMTEVLLKHRSKDFRQRKFQKALNIRPS